VQNDIHDLGLVLDSRVKLIVIESWDEPRVLETLTGLAVRRGLNLQLWSATEGLQRLGFGGEPQGEGDSREAEHALRLIKADPQPNLYVLCDLHPYLVDNPRAVRLLKEIAMAEGNFRPTVVLVSHALKLPAEVQRFAARFALSLPSEDELVGLVREEASRWSERNKGARVRTDNRTLRQVVKNLRGLTHGEARLLARSVICNDGAITQEDLPELNRTKFELLNLDGVLSFEHDTARFAEVGGLANLKRWLGERQSAFTDSKDKDLPKGCCWLACRAAARASRRRPWPASGGCRCCAWTSAASTTSISARPSATCAKPCAWRTAWLPACSGRTKSRRAWRQATRTTASASECWRPC
jgi:hypothetical protein